ncbi:MAG: hypothetical protein KIH03_11390 [Paludibacteraceae bacterium]|nr:hypothetical protein [Paludibacteraceae bacterium]
MENLNPNDLASINTAKVVLNSPNVVCECGCKVFVPGYALKKVSPLISPTGKEEIVEIPMWICSKCGEVPAEYKSKPNYAKIIGDEVNNENILK